MGRPEENIIEEGGEIDQHSPDKLSLSMLSRLMPRALVFVFSTLLLSVSGIAAAKGKANYVIDEHAISLTTTFSVEKNGKEAGEVVKKIIALTPTYVYTDASGACMAEGRRSIVSLGNEVVVKDCAGGVLGTIHENVVKTFFGFGIKTSYRITGEDNKVMAQSEATKFLTTDFNVSNVDGSPAMEAHRPMFNIAGDTWTMTIHSSPVDERVFVLLAVFKTDADNEREEAEDEEERREEERRQDEDSGW